ncbi:MAG: hypothetical protein LBH69_05670 [Methanomassiliicoccaceae archaeon]|jgi:DNA replication initiation complex subunit (GINS family)|nr:hypothetical protein [Methanomassiliicoccaceae archaeon]
MAQDNDPMTFDDLTSAYRVEMRSPMLAEVRKDLYQAMARLQESNQKDYEAEYAKDPDSLAWVGLNERRMKINTHIQKVIDLRMEKVALMALRTSMGASNVLEKLTQEEREYYISVAEASKKHRNTVLKDRSKRNYVIPDISPNGAADNAPAAVSAPPAAEPLPETPAADAVRVAEPEGEMLVERPRMVFEEPREELVTIRILEDLPKIAGPDFDYELKREDVVRMPVTLANAFINHGKAVRLNVTP